MVRTERETPKRDEKTKTWIKTKRKTKTRDDMSKFHSVTQDGDEDGVLYMEDQSLHTLVSSNAPKDSELWRAFGRMAAEVLDSQIGADGVPALQRKHLFGSIRDALAILVSKGKVVELSVSESFASPEVILEESYCEFRVAAAWSEVRLVECRKRNRSTDCGRITVHDPVHTTASHVFRVPLTVSGALVASTVLNWTWIYRTESMALRIATSPREHGTGTVVTLYRCDVWWDENVVEQTDLHMHVHIDVRNTHPSVWGETGFPIEVSMDTDFLSNVFLKVSDLSTWSRIPIVCDMFVAARIWRCALRWQSSCIKEWNRVANDRYIHDAFASLIDIETLLKCRRHDNEMQSMGIAILRRMQSQVSLQTLDMKANAIADYAVASFQVVPFTAQRFAQLYDLGVFEHWDDGASRYGFVYGNSQCRTIVVPHGCQPSDMTIAIGSLLTVKLEGTNCTLPDMIFLPFATVHSEHMAIREPNDDVYPYGVKTTKDGITLFRDHKTSSKKSHASISIDGVKTSSIAASAHRPCQMAINAAFPQLSRRLKLQSGSIEACLREVQCRRTSKEWRLDDFDVGGNLSSLGTSVLLSLCLAGWVGAKVRVFMSAGRMGYAGVKDVNGDFILIDVTCTAKNAFQLAPSLTELPESGRDVLLKKGLIVEVHHHHSWYLGEVTQINSLSDTAVVRCIGTTKTKVIGLYEPSWRPLSRGGDSNVSRIVSSLWKRACHLPMPSD